MSGKETMNKCRYILVEASISRQSSGDINKLIILLDKINPEIKLIHIGRQYGNEHEIEAVDLLFYNKSVERQI